MHLSKLAPLCVVLSLLTGCTALGGERSSGGVIYQDDFSVESEDWLLESDLDASASYVDGQLQLRVSSPNLIAWAELKEHQFDDFELEAEVTQLSGPDNNSYGIVFRMKSPSAHYSFDISGDGYYRFNRRDEAEGGRWTEIIDWLESPAIHRGASTNMIRIVAQGDQFTFYINGQLVAEANDDGYRSGSIGLNAGSFHEPGVEIAFDNLVVRRP